MAQVKPRVFIGSSVEGIEYANAVFSELERYAEPKVWDVCFRPSRSTLPELERIVREHDFAVLILTPDDRLTSRGNRYVSPRDNVVAELGMFIGSRGASRTFFIKPRDVNLRLPSDFLGIRPLDTRLARIATTDHLYALHVRKLLMRFAPLRMTQAMPHEMSNSGTPFLLERPQEWTLFLLSERLPKECLFQA